MERAQESTLSSKMPGALSFVHEKTDGKMYRNDITHEWIDEIIPLGLSSEMFVFVNYLLAQVLWNLQLRILGFSFVVDSQLESC